MLVDFDTLNNESTVWVYQSDRTISKNEITEIELEIKKFLILIFSPNTYLGPADQENLKGKLQADPKHGPKIGSGTGIPSDPGVGTWEAGVLR